MENNRYAKSKELLDRASKVLASGVSSEFRKYNHPHALFYDYAHGSMIRDVDGNEYIDFTLSQGPLILGHSNKRVLDAVESYSREGQLYAGQHLKEIELAEKLQEIIPTAELMRFCLDGSEAVQTAFRVARSKTKRNLFLRFEGHYHGWLDNVAYGISVPQEGFGSRDKPNISPWSQGMAVSSSSEFILIPWNDVELLEKTIGKYKDELAAVITEPIMCNNGCIPPRAGYLEKMRELCSKYGIALIFDEVITGFRMSLSGAQGYFNIQPDLSIYAKAMGSGYPISAIVGKKEWMEEISSGRVIHAGTLNASNPTVAASLATIEELQADTDVYSRLFRLGNDLKSGLEELAAKHGQNLLVQGPGPMFNTSFTNLKAQYEYRDLLQNDKAKLNQFISQLHEEGIRVIGRGLWYISSTTTDEDVSKALVAAGKVLKHL
ncbi:aspartate aminotransferase family protein [Sphingobacterium hotanense]|uniref:Aspartate aminotransferase family protein n=1 Tax=Sphingobacterium hotanense TaxID=649196 RepID=A0ABT7NNC4_9SPHI|nr:aspartate aminotransferase family protein [Sphingobacterium hotanense]MDM1048681.1 aspartate aminotransferase family protein [Sphingobacterium hotanense]